jgi:iron complex outermembrane receptor protein
VKLEDLMNIRVTSVSKHEQTLSRAAAAVFVIRQEDIRRSGATNIPDLLRMVPDVDVERIDANAWAISVRGFNQRYANKVLVLVDGRTVYTSSFSGVFWEHLDIPLDDIERIEVIRGPGAAVWGANAVNGVISIITKSAKETQGRVITAGAGSDTHVLGRVQYGGTAGPGAYRVFGDYLNVGNSEIPGGLRANDRWQRLHAGFRSDWNVSDHDSLTVEGDLFANEANQTRHDFVQTPFDVQYPGKLDAAGGSVLLRWNHLFKGGSETIVQTYYDSYRRSDLSVPEVYRSFDLDVQHHMKAGDRNEIVWGVGARVNYSSLSPGYSVGFTPPSATQGFYSSFVEDEIRLASSLWLTAGSKFEHNVYTGFQTEPSLRMVWSPPQGRRAAWVAASRAMRQPSRQDTDIQITLFQAPVAPGIVQIGRLFGNPRLPNEEVRDYEAGYRSNFTRNLSLDVTAFLSFYRHLATFEPLPLQYAFGTTLQIIAPYVYDSKSSATNYGGEAALNWTINSHWRISPGYAHLHAALHMDPTSQGVPSSPLSTAFPTNMLQMRSDFNLTRNTQFDQSLYYTARLPGSTIPGHARLDLRFARRLSESAEFSVAGQNLLRPRTFEFGNSYGVTGTEAVRSVFASVTWKF